jgi:hypothetical protein
MTSFNNPEISSEWRVHSIKLMSHYGEGSPAGVRIGQIHKRALHAQMEYRIWPGGTGLASLLQVHWNDKEAALRIEHNLVWGKSKMSI